MTELTRRQMLAGTAAAAIAATVPLITTSPARAAPPQFGKQAPGFYRYKLGSFEITVVTDGKSRVPITDDFVLNAKKSEVQAALAALFMDTETFYGPYNPIVVNTGTNLAVIDTGNGEAAYRNTKGLNGQFLTNLAAAGIDAGAIDTVIISHYHGDHINGLLKADNSLAFPNAMILVPAPEHRYWMSDDEMKRVASPRIEMLFKNARRVISGEVLKRLRTYEWGEEVIPGITAVATPGQSPGHTSHIVASGNNKVFVHADVTHAPYLFVRNPGWHAYYDHDPVKSEETRRKVLEMLATSRMLVQGYHFPFPGVAHIEKTATGYREIPVQWDPLL
jgi:glyoxylase-like metal-dependent hydrolase (beta-lactamase superfamily II)